MSRQSNSRTCTALSRQLTEDPPHTKDCSRPKHEQLYRYWVDIRDVRDGSARTPPLSKVRLVYIPTRKTATPEPDEPCLEMRDDSAGIETPAGPADLVAILRAPLSRPARSLPAHCPPVRVHSGTSGYCSLRSSTRGRHRPRS